MEYNQQTQQVYIGMNTHTSEHECRDISSSEDRCKCEQCRDTFQLQLFCKKPLANIHQYRHLKKRQPPPVKKDLTKDYLLRPKALTKPEIDPKLAATPIKYKPDRSKQANAGGATNQYHMVSQSQRVKPAKQDDSRRDERLRAKVRSNYEGLRQTQEQQNTDNHKTSQRQNPSTERPRVDASPNPCISPQVDHNK